MDISNLCDVISNLAGYKIYPYRFPENESGDLCKLQTTTGMLESGGVYDFNFEIEVKSSDSDNAKNICLDLITKLHKITDISYDMYQIILCLADNPAPIYKEKLENNEYIFACKFRLLANIFK